MIDCDVHQNFNSLHELVPWLDPAFRDYVEVGGYTGYQLPNYPWVHPSGFMMGDAVPGSGGVPGSDYETMREQLLDRFDVEHAVLTGEDILNVSCMAHPQFASALATAHNRWLLDEWLPRDARLRGSLVVATQDADAAAREIRARGAEDGIVQVIVACGARSGYGDPHFAPIFDAAVELGLPVAMHVGAEGLAVNPPPTATGYPAYYLEWHTLLIQSAMSHVVSLIVHGVFERLPELRVVVIEAGVAWLPAVLWRLDANWKALRSETPWVKRLPSEQAREHLRFTTQPLEQPKRKSQLSAVLEAVDGLEDMLMFATDYPHWDFDAPRVVEPRIPESWREKVMSENARALYRLPARAPAGA
jgi:predicted TIM-barrel fold metal-dependent hydrolase